MRIMVTGSHGTVGKALCSYLEQKGHTVVAWDRNSVSFTDYWAMENYLRSSQIKALYHLAVPSQKTGLANESWLVNYQWTSELAWLCKVLDVQFIFISTVMVFSSQSQGPFTVNSPADAGDGYGMEKRLAEERVFYQNPSAKVVRLGWQIGESPGSNNMLDFFESKMQEEGIVSCSTRWLPACSFISDTVQALENVLSQGSGLYLFDTNEKWNFYQIAFALNQIHGKRWKITATDKFVFDQRMQDERFPHFSLQTHLPVLK
ncbi:MAG: sugar nucleotide-binding protein [Spirochaetales bacterium]|nr:sugar nucleotide-binding protein [Spirochaetales bacterium]